MDTEALLQALAGENPCGANLEDTQLLASFDAYRVFGQSTPLTGEQDWREIKNHSLEALKESKDLRLLAHLAVASLRIDGLKAFIDLLGVAASWLSTHWAQVYPLVDEDAILRRNALNGLADGMAVLDALRRIPLVTHRQLGAVSFRDIEIAGGRIHAAEGEPAGPGADQIRATFTATPPEELQALSADLDRAIESLKGISDTMSEQGGGSDATPDFAPLSGIFAAMRTAVKPFLPVETGPGAEGAEGGTAPGGAGGGLGPIRSREDAVRVLDAVAQYFRSTEPSSPVPLFVDRAKRLVALNFLELMADVAPDALGEVKRLGGIKDDS